MPWTIRGVKCAKRERRNAQIYFAYVRGFPMREIAPAFELTERQCRRIVEAYRQSQPPLVGEEALAHIDDLFEQYRAAREELALVAAVTTSDAARIQAISGRIRVWKDEIRLRQLLGLLPRARVVPSAVGALDLWQQLAQVLREHGAPVELYDGCLAVVEGWTTAQGRNDPRPLRRESQQEPQAPAARGVLPSCSILRGSLSLRRTRQTQPARPGAASRGLAGRGRLRSHVTAGAS